MSDTNKQAREAALAAFPETEWTKPATLLAFRSAFEGGFFAHAALTFTPVSTDVTELIAEANEWLEKHTSSATGRRSTEANRVAGLVAALESLSATTPETEWGVLAEGDQFPALITDEETAQVIAKNNPEFYTAAHRTKAGPWIPATTPKEQD